MHTQPVDLAFPDAEESADLSRQGPNLSQLVTFATHVQTWFPGVHTDEFIDIVGNTDAAP